MSSHTAEHEPFIISRNPVFVCICAQVCRDFLSGKCNRASCKYVHSAEHDVSHRSDPTSDVCKDFLNGRCSRPVCRYYHPPTSSTQDAVRPSEPESTTMMSSAPESSVRLLETTLCASAGNSIVCLHTLQGGIYQIPHIVSVRELICYHYCTLYRNMNSEYHKGLTLHPSTANIQKLVAIVQQQPSW